MERKLRTFAHAAAEDANAGNHEHPISPVCVLVRSQLVNQGRDFCFAAAAAHQFRNLLARLIEGTGRPEVRAWAHNGALMLYLLTLAAFWWLTAPRAVPVLAGALLLLAAAAVLVLLSLRRVSLADFVLGQQRQVAPALWFAVAVAVLALPGVLANAQGRSAAREIA